jgi:hypothetical protein
VRDQMTSSNDTAHDSPHAESTRAASRGKHSAGQIASATERYRDTRRARASRAAIATGTGSTVRDARDARDAKSAQENEGSRVGRSARSADCE